MRRCPAVFGVANGLESVGSELGPSCVAEEVDAVLGCTVIVVGPGALVDGGAFGSSVDVVLLRSVEEDISEALLVLCEVVAEDTVLDIGVVEDTLLERGGVGDGLDFGDVVEA